MYEFQRFGILVKWRGLPIYAGNRPISHNDIVWWWPINWIAYLVAALLVLFNFIKEKIK